MNRRRNSCQSGCCWLRMGSVWAVVLSTLISRSAAQMPPPPPVITNQPMGQVVVVGSTATFTVGAQSSVPMTYQWRFNGSNIYRATNVSYTRFNVQTNHAGDYNVIVCNSGGCTPSSIATLTVLVPPQFTMQPESQVVMPGQTATFSVGISDASERPLTYQWRADGVDLPDAHEPTLVLSNVQPSHAALYTALVTNVAGAVTSAPAPLSVVASRVTAQWGGLTNTNPGYNAPDPHGAAGPQGILATVNLRIAYYTKTGALLWGPNSITTFWAPAGTLGSGTTDPKVLYDREARRFYVIVAERSSTQSFLNLAVSKTDHPQTSTADDWYFHRLDVLYSSDGTNYGGEYPAIGMDYRAVYVTLNMFALPNGTTGYNCQILVFPKSTLTNGSAALFRFFTPAGRTNGFTLQPVTVFEAVSASNDVAYFAETPYDSSDFVRLWALHGTGPSDLTLTNVVIPIPNNGGPITGAPQAGTSAKLDTVSPLTQGNAFWQKGSVWFCHTAGGASGKAAVFYYKIDCNNFPNGEPTLDESGFIDGGLGVWTFQPAMSANWRGDICLAYCQSSTSTFPAIAYTTRRVGAAVFDKPAILKLSPSYFNGFRWGDYATVSPDPVDGSFWICHEWARSTAFFDWGTWWGNVATFVPLHLFAGRFEADGFHFRVSGPATGYVIEASDDFTNWLPITTTNASNGSMDLVDPAASSFKQRFYRARAP